MACAVQVGEDAREQRAAVAAVAKTIWAITIWAITIRAITIRAITMLQVGGDAREQRAAVAAVVVAVEKESDHREVVRHAARKQHRLRDRMP